MREIEVIIRPIITEKSLKAAAKGFYTFEVDKKANKEEIKKAIAEQFKVKPLGVRTMVVKGKTKKAGRKRNKVKTSSWKKAIVLLPQEAKIDIFPTEGIEPQSGLPIRK